MQYVLLADHTAETCPTSNSKTRDLLLKRAPEIPNTAKNAGVKIIAGPLVNREHLTVIIVDSEKAESVDQFISDSGLGQWNKVQVLPSQSLEHGMEEISRSKAIF